MIPFEPRKLYVEHVFLKSVTTALSGSISVVDDKAKGEKETYKRISVPMAVVRKFVEENKQISRYMTPVLTAVAYYDGHAVALERHPLYGRDGKDLFQGVDGQFRAWTSGMEANIDKFIAPAVKRGSWFIDGSFIYSVDESNLKSATSLSTDGRFKSVSVKAIKLADIHKAEKMSQQEDRTCLLYKAKTGKTALSPPIWKQLSGVGEGKIGLTESEDEGKVSADALGVCDGKHQFDRIDETLAVNLSFALRAGKEIADVFGYDAIEPLGLDEVMIQLKTVNLPRVAKEVKATFDVGIPFTHAIAWLLGLTTRTESLKGYIALRSLLKYLTTKGIYRRNSFTPQAVFRGEMSRDSVALLSPEQALESVQKRFAGGLRPKGLEADLGKMTEGEVRRFTMQSGRGVGRRWHR